MAKLLSDAEVACLKLSDDRNWAVDALLAERALLMAVARAAMAYSLHIQTTWSDLQRLRNTLRAAGMGGEHE